MLIIVGSFICRQRKWTYIKMIILFYLSPSFTCLVNRQQFCMLTTEGARKRHPAVPVLQTTWSLCPIFWGTSRCWRDAEHDQRATRVNLISHIPYVRSSPVYWGSFKTHRLRRFKQVQRLIASTAVMLSGTERDYNQKISIHYIFTKQNTDNSLLHNDLKNVQCFIKAHSRWNLLRYPISRTLCNIQLK